MDFNSLLNSLMSEDGNFSAKSLLGGGGGSNNLFLWLIILLILCGYGNIGNKNTGYICCPCDDDDDCCSRRRRHRKHKRKCCCDDYEGCYYCCPTNNYNSCECGNNSGICGCGYGNSCGNGCGNYYGNGYGGGNFIFIIAIFILLCICGGGRDGLGSVMNFSGANTRTQAEE